MTGSHEGPAPDERPAGLAAAEADGGEGGEAACWAHLLCPDCGAVSGEAHREGCPSGT